jgi:hypothetical protein
MQGWTLCNEDGAFYSGSRAGHYAADARRGFFTLYASLSVLLSQKDKTFSYICKVGRYAADVRQDVLVRMQGQALCCGCKTVFLAASARPDVLLHFQGWALKYGGNVWLSLEDQMFCCIFKAGC